MAALLDVVTTQSAGGTFTGNTGGTSNNASATVVEADVVEEFGDLNERMSGTEWRSCIMLGGC